VILPEGVTYAGFWIRTGAAVIDSILVIMVTLPLLLLYYGPSYFSDLSGSTGPLDFLLSWLFPAAASVLFWIYRQATPGKIMMSLHVVDASTGSTLSVKQAIFRYLGYFVALLPLGLGILWVAFDKRKQGWQDKLAGSVVLRDDS